MTIQGQALLVGSLIAVGTLARAQEVNPAGHWEGTISIPGAPAGFSIDVARSASGEWVGTITGSNFANLPLTRITIAGRSIDFEARSDAPLAGELSADGNAIVGDAVVESYSLPFQLTRTGEARIAPTPTSEPFSTALEGRWEGVLQLTTRTEHVTLMMENTEEGRGRARMVNVDEGGLTVPAVVTQNDASVTVELHGLEGFYSGKLDAQRTEIGGTFTQGSMRLPLTFHRAKGVSK
jgi:hypothetical protein